MGLIKSMNVGTLVGQATKAFADGRTLFVAQLADSAKPAVSTELPTIAEMIIGVEALGWRLDQISPGVGTDRPCVVAIFRRGRRPVVRSSDPSRPVVNITEGHRTA